MMIADGSLFTDMFIGAGNNSLFAISAMRWLSVGNSLGGYWFGAQALRDQGYGVMSLKQFNATILEGTDALILVSPIDTYSASEKAIIEEYVSIQGNGLFLIGEPITLDSTRDIAAEFGIGFDSLATELEDEDDYVSELYFERFLLDENNIRTHSITQGVDGLLWIEGVAIGDFPSNAEVILEMDNDAFSEWTNGTPALQAAMMVAVNNGNGRVVALGDSTFWQSRVYIHDVYGDNETMAINELDDSLIMLNAVNWLVGGGGSVLPFELPWFALPALGIVAVVVIIGGVALRRRSGGKKKPTKRKTTKRKTKKK
jgi:hypothetical protein